MAICGSNLFCELRFADPIFGGFKTSANLQILVGQTWECGNGDCGRAIPFLGIFVSNFQYWFLQCTFELAQ